MTRVNAGLAIPVDLSAGVARLLLTAAELPRLRVDKGVFGGLLVERNETRALL